MNETEAIDRVRAYIHGKYPDYPTDNLVAERFEVGWTVFPQSDPEDFGSLRIGQTIFLIGDSGIIMETSSSLPPGQPEAEFTRLHGTGS
ncbi:hypothetical protein [Glycomyces buryatensis]|uniref:Uncharacterized protein n=1 Tax=Glycomyces buryatensis TaxID=2570927 RepID=A0A4S8PY58_9ACTN|nr:hypothetical protein [Glycomyces buryatensis]THV35591.1 hypothetical protein FAB82_23275 [Glycomyces buryatensis]